MCRAESYVSQHLDRKLYVVLSYVTAFFSEKDWQILSRLKSPTFILDSHLVVKAEMGSSQVLGDGLVAYNMDLLSWFQLKKECISFERRVRYSENLLALKDYHVDTISEALMYRVQMSSLETVQCSNDQVRSTLSRFGVSTTLGSSGVLLLDNVRDFVLHRCVEAYVSSLGKVVSEIEEVIENIPLRSRVVYVTDDTPVWRARTSLIDKTLYNGRLYFAWAIDSDISLPYSFVSRDKVEKGTLTFKKYEVRAREPPHIVVSSDRLLFTYQGDVVLLPLKPLSILVLVFLYYENIKQISHLVLKILSSMSSSYDKFEMRHWLEDPWQVFDHAFSRIRDNTKFQVQLGPFWILLSDLKKDYLEASLLKGEWRWSVFVKSGGYTRKETYCEPEG